MPLQSQRSHTSRRALIGALVALLIASLWAASGRVPTASAATAASTTLCSGFDSCASKGMSHDGYKTAKSNMYWNMYSGVNCTNYVAYRMIRAGMSSTRPSELKTGLGNATYWGGSFGSLTTSTPMVGSVAWWKANTNGVGSAGHVARVEAVLSNGDIQISESNYGSEFTWRQLTKGGNRWPSGFIHLKDSVVTVTSAPGVSGTPQVGVPLTATTGSWTPTPTSYSYQWWANDVAISGATGSTYTPTAAEVGKTITTTVWANAAGYVQGITGSTRSAAVQPGTQTVTSAPTVSGTAQVDETLTASPGSYSPGADSISYQWLADGKAIDGATKSTFVPTKEQADARVSVKVTAAKAGYTAVSRTSSATDPVLAPAIRVTTAAITGVRHVGEVLTADVQTADPVDATKVYQWFRDGAKIKGARSATYQLKRADTGSAISAKVAVSAHGYVGRTLKLKAVRGIVVPVTATVRTDPQSAKSVWVKVILAAPGGAKPTGTVAIKVGKELHRGKLTKNGTVRLRFTHAGSGTRAVKVYYKGRNGFTTARAATTVQVPAKRAGKGR
ncbi:MAG: CHAP domain-containing protein [Nocardioides sp.]|uniref:CHAP domain-containing protein n=1 Tax=Nocardioides sp. TaxID=35761 RepID=UPI0039E5582A